MWSNIQNSRRERVGTDDPFVLFSSDNKLSRLGNDL